MAKSQNSDKSQKQDNQDEILKKENNEKNHTKKGNENKMAHIKFLHLNSSNAHFETKSLELRTTVNYYISDVVMISESNMDTSNKEKMYN